jgi:processive 1,2-diacylglycerol beta-glucosyltransferase
VVVVLSASLGAGHDGAAEELARRLEERGYRAPVVDYLGCFPLRIGAALRGVYRLQLRAAPWAYEATFRVWYLGPWLRRALTVVLGLLTRRRLTALLADPAVCGVVSTYPLQALVLGRARRRGRLGVPVATFVTDFGVHPLWIHPGVDLTICVHGASAEEVRRRTGRPVVAAGPAVRPEFRRGPVDRAAARRALGVAAGARVALIVAGAWGVGDVEATFDDLHATGTWLPVAACGGNEALRARLASRGYGLALGWTDRMHQLMSAADVLVQNAGGLSCMEAFALGLPVVTFRPLAGHGRVNAARMHAAGVAETAPSGSDLAAVLERAVGPDRDRLVAAGRAVFSGDAAAVVDRLVVTYPAGSPAPRLPSARRTRQAGAPAPPAAVEPAS